MRFRSLRHGFGLAALALLTACTEEAPTDIGGPLVSGVGVRTFEVVLEASQFLVFDTAFSGYADAFDTNILAIARNFEGVTSSNALVRYNRAPASLQVRDLASSTVRTDSAPRFLTGDLVLKLDTARSRGTGTINIYRNVESWDAPSATWTLRADTSGVRVPWTTPGGTRGALIGSRVFTATTDSVVVPLDSALIARLTSTNDTTRALGTLITLDQPGAGGTRVRIASTLLRLNGKSSIRPDTTVVVNVDVSASTFVFTPTPDLVSSSIRVSGVPAWRSILSLRDDFKEIVVPCPERGCVVRLRDAHVNAAELLLRPTASPLGFSPEDSIRVEARSVLDAPSVPLSRSPVAEVVGVMARATPAARFTAGNELESPLGISAVIALLVADTTALTSPNRPPRRLALLTAPEAFSFGFATFRPGPRLRLILTTTVEQR